MGYEYLPKSNEEKALRGWHPRMTLTRGARRSVGAVLRVVGGSVFLLWVLGVSDMTSGWALVVGLAVLTALLLLAGWRPWVARSKP